MFLPDDLSMLKHLAEKVAETATWAGRRLVVEVWSRSDDGPVAWIEMHPEDSHPTVRFARENPDA